MISKRKIIIMSKLALYDKYDSARDFKKSNYYRHDYVYKRNTALRFFVLIGAVIVVLLYIMHKFAVDQIDIFALDIQGEIKVILIIVVAFLVIYTLIGTVKYNIDYEAAMKRLKRYDALMNLLEKEEKPSNK